MIDHITQLTTDNPTLVRQALLADLLIAAAFTTRMDQFDRV
jgi:hypothetical protein